MTRQELKSLRRRLGLSQAELARVLQLRSDRTVRKWEDGENDIAGPARVLLALVEKSETVRRLMGLKASLPAS